MDIEIEIEDERLFTDVALIVDHDDFKKEIILIRKEFGIKDLLPNDKFSDYFQKLEIGKCNEFDDLVRNSRKKLFLQIVFEPVIKKAALCGKVLDGDFRPAILESKIEAFDENTPDETYSIILSPWVRDKDVLRALQEYRDQLGNIEGASEYEFISSIWENEDGKPAIKNHREWYLKNKNGMSTEDICTELSDKCPYSNKHKTKPRLPGCTCFDESTIRKGIKDYSSLILKKWNSRTS